MLNFAVRPGVKISLIGKEITDHAAKNGCSVVRSYTGHGIGHLFHTTPTVCHHWPNRSIGICAPGQTFTVEPMINQGLHMPTDNHFIIISS